LGIPGGVAGPAGANVEDRSFAPAFDAQSEAGGKTELAWASDPDLELGLMDLSGGPDRSPSAFRFVPLLVLGELLATGLLTSLVASSAGLVGFAGVGFWAGFGGAGD
jgi:hypothetical protein